jgi:hypothetical protein
MRALVRHSGRLKRTLTAFFALTVVAVVVSALPEVNPAKGAGSVEVVAPEDIDQAVRRWTPGRAVVLLRYDPLSGARMRPYNLDVAHPDDAPIIKALDLGPRNGEIFAYYGALHPDRVFFLYDFAGDTLTRLGTGTELAALQSVPSAATRPALVE